MVRVPLITMKSVYNSPAMKGLVMAGGKGSRLRPFTYSGAKQLVPVANVPVLHFSIQQMVEAGIEEIGLVVGDTEAQVREAMGDGRQFGARFTYLRQTAPLGIAHGILVGREFLRDDPFVLYLGDNVLLGGIGPLLETFRAGANAAAVVLREVADPRAFGVAQIAGGRLLHVHEKPAEPLSNLAVIGVYAFSALVHAVVAAQRPSARGELEIADAINGLIDAGHQVSVFETREHWIDTGKMEDILAANRIVLESFGDESRIEGELEDCEVTGPVFVAPGATVRRSRLIGPLCIAEDAIIEGCTVGPHVAIGARTLLRSTAIRNTIVMEDTEVTSSPDIRDSMLGRHVVVCGAPAGTSLTLGDHSRVEGTA